MCCVFSVVDAILDCEYKVELTVLKIKIQICHILTTKHLETIMNSQNIV
jgi:hypothetical protein